MYLETLEVTGLKLLRDLRLDFLGADAARKKWTVLIGRNGTGKTSVLQAIALAAMGRRQINDLARPALPHLRDRRKNAPDLKIEATFSFSNLAFEMGVFPGLREPKNGSVKLLSQATMRGKKASLLDASSRYTGADYDPAKTPDPLDSARDEKLKLWFVAGYGPGRFLPESSYQPNLDFPQLARLKPLFDPRAPAVSTAFTNHFGRANGGAPTKARRYVKLLNRVLFDHPDVLPMIERIERRGTGGVDETTVLQETPRFEQQIGNALEKIPAVGLAHGHQSTIAWIADLIGHVTLEATTEISPEDMRGLVLIDEIDLYLHPTWQVRFVRALKETFPNLQFIVTTHSPLVLASLDPKEDQIVRLEADPVTGNVRKEVMPGDPRVLTSAELLRTYFDLDDVHPDPVGRMVRDYRYLASNPYRDDEDDMRLSQWRDALKKAGVDPGYEPVRKQVFARGAE